ncbi:unnamed protein product, partial [Rotaria socialis]
ISSPKSLTSVNDDDYLNTLAQWDPNAIQTMIESDEEEEEEQVDMRNDVQTTQDNNTNANSMDLSTGKLNIFYCIINKIVHVSKKTDLEISKMKDI